MEYKKKKPSGLLIFFGILAAIAVGMYLVGRFYNSPAKRYEEMWHIGLPPDIKTEYNVESDHGFQGDGLWYTVFRTDGSGKVQALKYSKRQAQEETEMTGLELYGRNEDINKQEFCGHFVPRLFL